MPTVTAAIYAVFVTFEVRAARTGQPAWGVGRAGTGREDVSAARLGLPDPDDHEQSPRPPLFIAAETTVHSEKHKGISIRYSPVV
jgi:hypothetical protein